MQVAVLLYDGVTALDAVGPYEVLKLLPGTDIRTVAVESGLKTTEQGPLRLMAEHSLDEIREPEIVVVPGGKGNRVLLDDQLVLDWLRSAHATSRWTTSVCTGSLLLAAAGVLDGIRATTHWLFTDRLRELGAVPVDERVVVEGKIITSAGVSAGIDMALQLAALEASEEVAQGIQLAIEYDPSPLFDSGSPSKAPDHLVERIRKAAAR